MNDTAPARAPQASVIMPTKATAATAAPSAIGCALRTSTTSAASALRQAAALTRRQLRATVLGTSAMLAQTAPLATISAAACGPARALATSWMAPMPSATSMPLIACAGNSRQARTRVGSRMTGTGANARVGEPAA